MLKNKKYTDKNLVECYSPNCQWGIEKVNFFTFRKKRAGFKSKLINKNKNKYKQ